MKNIIFENNSFNKTSIKFSNLFKTKFTNENLEKFKIKECNTFLCTMDNSKGYETLDIDKHSIID